MADNEVPGFPTPAVSWPQSGVSGLPGASTNAQTAARIASMRANFIELILQQVVQAVTGFLLPGSSFNQLQGWAEDLQEAVADFPVLGDLVEALTGIEDGDLNDVGSAFLKLRNALQGIDLDGDPGAVLAAIGSAVVEWVRNLLPSFLGRIPIGSLTGNPTNAVPVGDFPNAASILDNPYWTFDPTVSLTADGTGSARGVCTGVERKLVMKDIVSVDAGQEVALGGALKWSGVSASGVAFRFGVRTFHGDSVVDSFVEQVAISSPVAASTSHPGNVAGVVSLAKDWTVPVGVDGYKIVVVRTAAATAGTVWFDNASGKQTGSILLEWIPEAVQKFLGIFNIFGDGGLLEEMQEAWENLLKVLGLNSKLDLLGPIDLGAIWQGIVEFLINPIGFFANLVDGILPDAQKPKWLADLTDGIGNLFFGSANLNLAISNAVESLTGIWGAGKSAQTSADDANIKAQIILARLDAVGTVGFDEFDYDNGNALPGDKYALSSAGPGGGNYGPNGAGQLVWKPSGFTAREKVYKRTDMPLQTNNGVVTAVWSSRIKDPLFSDGYGYLCGRMFDVNNNTYVRARIDNNSAVIQAVVGGVVTSIGSSASVDTQDGDVWEFWYGTLTNPYLFWLKRNGVTVPFGPNRFVEDAGHVSQLGSSYLMCGVGGRADNYAAVFQIAPPTLNGWTWRDQNATAVS